MNRPKIVLAAALGCAISLYFLGAESQLPNDDASAVNAEIANTSNAKPSAFVSAGEATPNGQDPNSKQEPVAEPITLAYEPPFPERTNFFQAPKRQGTGRIKTNGQSETEVELLGFVNVFGPEVVLSIDGLAATISEGGKQEGIEVISIQPPSVFLQRGKQRWQATLEN